MLRGPERLAGGEQETPGLEPLRSIGFPTGIVEITERQTDRAQVDDLGRSRAVEHDLGPDDPRTVLADRNVDVDR